MFLSLFSTGFTVTNKCFEKIDFKWAFGPNRFNLQFLGLWRSTSDPKTQRIFSDIRFSIVQLTIVLSCIVPCFLALEKVWGNLTLMVENLQFTLPLSASVIKVFALWSKREVLAMMNDMVLTDWLKEKTSEEHNVMKKWARISRIITTTGNLLAYLTFLLLVIPPWFGLSVRIETFIKGIDRRLIIQSYFIYNISKTTNFAFTYFMQVSGVAMGTISYTGVDNYLIVLIFHICAQLDNLNARILSMGKFQDFRYNLASCVQEHVQLLRFIDIIDNSFTMMLLVLLIYFGLLFCFYGFIIVSQVNAEDLPFGRVLFIVCAVIFTFSHMCLFCVIGEILVIKCDSIFYSTYDYEWYALKPQDARCLICLMIRANRPRYITAGKLFPMTMSTFCSLLKTSGGYISVLVANQK